MTNFDTHLQTGDPANAPDDEPEPELICLDGHGEPKSCKGAVEYRTPLSGTGRSFPRCDAHWSKRLDVQAGINRRYPTHAPSDFDPYYAGESWDEDY